MKIRVILFFFALLSTSAQSTELISSQSCMEFHSINSVPSEQHAILLEKITEGTIRICSQGVEKQTKITFVVSSPKRSRRGTCMFYTRPVFHSSVLGEWSFLPPEGESSQYETQWYMAKMDDCLSAQSRKYVATSNVSEGVFLRIFNFWESISKDAVELGRVFRAAGPRFLSSQEYRVLSQKLDALRGAHDKVRIGEIAFSFSATRPPHYVLRVELDDQLWSLNVEFDANSVVLLDVAKGID